MIGATLEDLETDRFASASGFAAGFAGALVQVTDPRVLLFHFICADESDTQKKVSDSSQESFRNPFCRVSSFTSPSANETFPSEQTIKPPFSSLHVPLKAESGIGDGLVAVGFGAGAAIGFGATRLGSGLGAGVAVVFEGATRLGSGLGAGAAVAFGATDRVATRFGSGLGARGAVRFKVSGLVARGFEGATRLGSGLGTVADVGFGATDRGATRFGSGLDTAVSFRAIGRAKRK